MNKIFELQKLIDEAKHIVVITGAGISTASGIPDFRSSSGIYNKKLDYRFTPEEMVSHSFFKNHKH